jgi:DNA-binding NtrC family response regulator
MRSRTVVIVHSDVDFAQKLADDLQSYFGRIIVSENALEFRTLLLRQETRGVVLDLESVKVEEIRQLARDFHNLTIVCTHRSPDEQMWIAALEAGATELCHTLDLKSMIRALRV